MHVLNVPDGKLYAMHILPQLKKKRNEEQKVLAMPPPSPGCLLSLLLPLGWPRGWGEPEEEQKWGSEHLLPGSALPSCFYCSPAPPPRSDRTQGQSLQGPCSQASEHMLFLLGAQQSSEKRQEAGPHTAGGGCQAETEPQDQEAEGPLEGLQSPGRCSALPYCPAGGQAGFRALNPAVFTSQIGGDNSFPPT